MTNLGLMLLLVENVNNDISQLSAGAGIRQVRTCLSAGRQRGMSLACHSSHRLL